MDKNDQIYIYIYIDNRLFAKLLVTIKTIIEAAHPLFLNTLSSHPNLEKEQAQGEVTGLPSFQPSNSTISPEPSTPQFASHLEQNRQMALKQTSLAKEEALTVSAKVKIGDCTKSSKHQLRQVSDRPDHEIFKNKFRRVHGQSFKAKKLKSHPI